MQACIYTCVSLPRLWQETTIEELKQQFIKRQDARGFVVDGFPRDIGQALTFEEQVRDRRRLRTGERP